MSFFSVLPLHLKLILEIIQWCGLSFGNSVTWMFVQRIKTDLNRRHYFMLITVLTISCCWNYWRYILVFTFESNVFVHHYAKILCYLPPHPHPTKFFVCFYSPLTWPSFFFSVIMSAGGEKSKSASQTDGKAAQNKMSEMGMMSYKVQWTHNHTQHHAYTHTQLMLISASTLVTTQLLHPVLYLLLYCLWLWNYLCDLVSLSRVIPSLPPDVRVRPGELPGPLYRDHRRVHECVRHGNG